MASTDYIVLPIPALPNTQALESKTFQCPPLDGSLSLQEIYDWHYHHTPDHPLFVFADDDGDNHTILWPQAVRAIHEAGRIVQSRVPRDENQTLAPVVAIVAAADSITYFSFIVGIQRAGFTAFPISPRNSPAAIAHLLTKTRTTHVLVGVEKSMQDLVEKSLEMITDPAFARPTTSQLPLFEDLYVKPASYTFEPLSPVRPTMDSVGCIMHSSGSTAFPKPIYWTHYNLVQMAIFFHFGERDVTAKRLGSHGLPMFHGMGMMLTCLTAGTGLVLAVFKPKSPATSPTPDAIFDFAVATSADFIFCVPAFIETWSRNAEYVEKLKKIDGLMFGGGPLNKAVGDELARKGVNIYNFYGSTELGVVNALVPMQAGPDWEYFKVSPHKKVAFEPDGLGRAEMIAYPSPYHTPCVLNAKRGDIDVFMTSDLLEEHPTKPGYWKIYGRSDDQIMHNTGEKTNPGPLENIINQDPHVQSAVMFGRGEFNAGILVDPAPGCAFDPSDPAKLEKFRNDIWPTVERLNEFAPQHSRLFKEMIIVSLPSKPFTYTAKGTPRRQAVINEYSAQISALYQAVGETSQQEISPPHSWRYEDSLLFARDAVHNVMGKSLTDEENIFHAGGDSLQAMWIRNTMCHALKTSSDVNTRSIAGNVVYEHPSIIALAHWATSLVFSEPTTTLSCVNKVDKMMLMAEKYTLEFPKHVGSVANPTGDVLLITGTTGGLGAALLAEAVTSAEITQVYAVNRKAENGVSLMDRQRSSLLAQGLDPDIVVSPKVTMVEADLNDPSFGIHPVAFNKLRTTVTHIIHNAWTVDFNLTLQQFQPQVAGIRNLVDFALSSPHNTPPPLLFTSSIAVLGQTSVSAPAKETSVDAAHAQGSGYGESKWVAEKVLETAASEVGLTTIIVRVGQVTGGQNGYWRQKEWFPSLVRSSLFLHAFPGGDQPVAWLPSDVAAKALIDMRCSPPGFLHLAHPCPVRWSTIAQYMSEALGGLPIVSYSEWLELLEHNLDVGDSNPASRLIDFFRAASMDADDSKEAMGLPRLELVHAREVSRTLKDETLRQIGKEDVERWLSYWRDVKFLPS